MPAPFPHPLLPILLMAFALNLAEIVSRQAPAAGLNCSTAALLNFLSAFDPEDGTVPSWEVETPRCTAMFWMSELL